ncbi:MAG: hypothetical protein M1537_00210 [Nitrospirae bacterium]|nr:hypothetical protein [Nitrospirota bacterium]MCL5284392.1 hypothetical protein [Nitrospirota bacterium]
MRRRLPLILGGVLGTVLVVYVVWLSFEPDRFLENLSRKTGLLMTARATSVGFPYRLTFEELHVAPPPGQGGGGVTVKIDHLVLSARDLHSAVVRFRGVTLGSRSPMQNLLLSAFDLREGSFFVREDPDRVVLKRFSVNDPSLHVDADGVFIHGSKEGDSRFRVRFVMEAHGGLGLFLGQGKQRGMLWGEGRSSHMKVGGRAVF